MAVLRKVSPDGGWGWVVTGAAAAIYFIMFGITTSQGLLIVGLMREYFPNDRARLTMIPIICNGITRLLAPASVFLSFKLSYRIVLLISGVLLPIGCVLSSLATSIDFLYVSYGVIIGIASSLSLYPSAILTTLYFDKHVSLANGIYTAGASIGCITVPVLVEYLLNSVGIKDTFVYLGCMALQICVAAALCQPVEWHLKTLQTSVELRNLPIDRPATHALLDLKASEAEVNEQLRERRVVLTRFAHIQSSLRQRPKEVIKRNSLVLNPRRLYGNSLSVCNGFPNAWNPSITPEDILQRQVSISSSVTCEDNHSGRRESHQSSIGRSSVHSRLSLTLLQGLRRASLPMSHPPDRIVRCPLRSEVSIPEEGENATMGDESASSIFSFLRSGQFYLLALSTTGLYNNLATLPIILPDFSLEEVEGTESMERAAYLISAASVADLLTRLSLSWLWDLSCINRRHWFLAANVFGGFCLIASGLAQTYHQLMACVVINGITTGIAGVLVAVLFMQIIGPESFGLSLSTASLLGGLFMIGTGSSIGILKEYTGSYTTSFLIIGGYQAFGSCFWFLGNCVRRGNN